ncbi:MAG TPA: hypothetical protein VE865_17570 [Bradyrhizobium sp.]|nr:hypothetical protein [Bradyrhizobium sp.]
MADVYVANAAAGARGSSFLNSFIARAAFVSRRLGTGASSNFYSK